MPVLNSHCLAAAGATIADTPAEAAQQVVLTVLTDLGDVRDVLNGTEGLIAGWERSAVASPVLVVMGTVSPTAVRELAAELSQRGIRLVDAPLSGGVQGAAEARLSIMVGCEPGDFDEILPVLATLGRTVRRMGTVGSGQLAKACNQLVVASTVTAVSEAMLLARSAGLDLAVLQELLLGGLASSEVLRQKGVNWLTEDFSAGGSAANQVKDLNYALAAADEMETVLPLSSTVRDLFRSLLAHGEGNLDHTAVYRTLQRLSGVPLPN
jgi:2-hydroxy-3-oxopropionate reductase